MAWSINAAHGADIPVFVSSDDDGETKDIAHRCAAEFIHCPTTIAHKDSDPDILWVRHALADPRLAKTDVFVLLRPTSPFRTAETVKRALVRFLDVLPDSLRAVERVKQHPYKMWTVQEDGRSATQWMHPFVNDYVTNNLCLMDNVTPYHSRPSQNLPPVYVQNASLEIFWRKTVEETGTISGTRIIPFFTTWPEGYDINDEADWREARYLAETGALLSIK